MKRIKRQSLLLKKARKGFRGYPIATIAFYGPTADAATKVAVGIVPSEGAGADVVERWWSEEEDVRHSASIGKKILDFIQEHGAKSVILADRIIGCPHEEGRDYPEGESCPQCPYWADRDRWTGEVIK
jgi:hypothetical protein